MPVSYTHLPVVAFLFVILLLVCAFVLRYTPFGRGVYAIGDNKSCLLYTSLCF